MPCAGDEGLDEPTLSASQLRICVARLLNHSRDTADLIYIEGPDQTVLVMFACGISCDPFIVNAYKMYYRYLFDAPLRVHKHIL